MDTATIRRDWVGSVVDGRFALREWLGGSDGSGVFLTEVDGSKKAAIKLIPAVDGDVEERIASWEATAPLSHPHLVRLLHTGRWQIGDAQLVYAVTEYAEEVLAEILPERALTPSEAREMLDPILDALFYLHGKGFVHGHLKPSNIMVVDNELKLSSDGLCRAGERTNTHREPGIHDAPECAAGTISPAADVWSFGVTLVEALTRNPPDWDRSADREPAVPRSMPQPFAGIAEECLRPDPARRCTLSYVKLCLDPARFLPVPASRVAKAARAKRRVTIVVAAVLALFLLVAVMLIRSRNAQPTAPATEQQPAPTPTTPAPLPQSPAAQPEASRAGGPVKGEVAEQTMPDVPGRARATIQGRVEVRIRVAVDANGDVANAAVESQGPSKYFANLALGAARSWKFKPAQVDGRAVSSSWILRFQFRQSGTEVAPVEVSP
jgi:TonB family protein